MLGKLLKYEFKATARTFFPLYLAVLAVSLLNTILYAFAPDWTAMDIIRGLTTMLYVFLVIGVLVFTFIVIVQRFYKNLLGDEGYLSMTLPVSVTSHLLSKLIAGTVWFIGTVIVIIASVFILVRDINAISDFFGAVAAADSTVQQTIGMSLPALIVVGLLVLFIGMITSILMIYTAISFGQLSDQHKAASSFGAYLVIYMIEQIIMLLVIILVSGLFFSGWNQTMDIAISSNDIATNAILPSGFVPTFLGVFGAQELILGCVYFFVSRFLLKRKLNLQ